MNYWFDKKYLLFAFEAVVVDVLPYGTNSHLIRVRFTDEIKLSNLERKVSSYWHTPDVGITWSFGETCWESCPIKGQRVILKLLRCYDTISGQYHHMYYGYFV